MKIEIFRSKKNKKWYFHAKASNGRILASSQGYKLRYNAWVGARSLLDGAKEYTRIVELQQEK